MLYSLKQTFPTIFHIFYYIKQLSPSKVKINPVQLRAGNNKKPAKSKARQQNRPIRKNKSFFYVKQLFRL